MDSIESTTFFFVEYNEYNIWLYQYYLNSIQSFLAKLFLAALRKKIFLGGGGKQNMNKKGVGLALRTAGNLVPASPNLSMIFFV